jgi:peroxiredoxin Q/BCP
VDLNSRYADFQARNTEIIALAVQKISDAEAMAQATGANFPILANENHSVADNYGVYNLLGDGVAAPAVFVIDRSGQIVWSHVGQDINDRPSAQTILDHLP